MALSVEHWTCGQEVVGLSLNQAPRRKNLLQVAHTHVPLSPLSKQYNLVLAIGRWLLTAGKITAGYPFVGRRNEYQPKSSDALQLGSKGRYGSCVGGR